MNGRVYDYNVGRFMSVDPVIQSPENSQSINPYSYIMNNPLSGVDPTGYVSCEPNCVGTGSRIKQAKNQQAETAVAADNASNKVAADAHNAVHGHSDNGAQKSSFEGAQQQQLKGNMDKMAQSETNAGMEGGAVNQNSNPNANLQVSSEQIELTKFNEGFKDKLYDDDGDLDGNTTIGYGTLVHKGPIDGRDSEKPFESGITKERAEELLIERLRVAETDVRSLVNVPLRQKQFDALVDLAYQVGRGQLSGTKLIEHINLGAMNKAANEFNFRRSNGKLIRGLQYRSNRRYNTFRNGDYRKWQDAKRYQVTISDL